MHCTLNDIWSKIPFSFNLNLLFNSFKEKKIYRHRKFESVVQIGGLGLKLCSFLIQEKNFASDFASCHQGL